jgi:hypothetical protein
VSGNERVLAPRADASDNTCYVVQVRVALDGFYEPARKAYSRLIQEYAESLENESARQEASARAPGVKAQEITENTVIRANESLTQEAINRARAEWEAVTEKQKRSKSP